MLLICIFTGDVQVGNPQFADYVDQHLSVSHVNNKCVTLLGRPGAELSVDDTLGRTSFQSFQVSDS